MLFIYLSFSLIFGERGFVRYLKLKSTRADLQAETKKVQDENEEIKKQVDILKKDPHAVENFARELGLTKKGEIIFKYEDETEK
ncbi:MAG: septum formation initiator family protein [Nitrospirae bacterium]|nr:septum formation initiator family protein [Nitrospirota bacterium]